MAKPTGITRLNDIYGPGNPIPVKRTSFLDNYVYRPAGDKCLPGTDIPRLRLVKLGARALGAFDDEIAALIEALRTARDEKLLRAPPRFPAGDRT
jgi:hypothetical protein